MLTQEQALAAALAHAKQRWCWDDESLIEEMLDGRTFISEAVVRDLIDEMAEHYDLIDPRTVGL